MNNTGITEGKRVAAMIDDKLITGTIKKTYSFFDIAIVETDDGEAVKVPYSKIIIKEVEEKPEPKQEPGEREVTITENQLIETIAHLVADDKDINPIVGMTFMIFGAKLAKKLFHGDEE